MAYGTQTFDKRLSENVKNYKLENLFDLGKVQLFFNHLNEALGVELLLTERHGEKVVSVGNFLGFVPDVVNEPGKKIKISGRTLGHLYVKYDRVDNKELAEKILDDVVDIYVNMGGKHYLYRETAIYADEMEKKVEKELYQVKRGEHEDALTGTLNQTYFESRLKKMEKDGVAPAAVICININDWKYANDHFGDEESDRLIRTVAGFIKKEAGENYLMGRVDGDVFYVVIPAPEDGEAEEYCQKVRTACDEFEDPYLAPSVAVGMVFKTNVEENFRDLFSDAEYEMFNNKFEVKNAPGYRERLEHGREKNIFSDKRN